MESSIRTAVAGLVATTRAKASRPREQRTRPGADRPTLLLLVALGLGGVLVALARTTTEPASITNVQVANADPRRPCDDPLLDARFRLAAPDTITFALVADGARTVVTSRQLPGGDRSVELAPRVALVSGRTARLVLASAADGSRVAAEVRVECDAGPPHV